MAIYTKKSKCMLIATKHKIKTNKTLPKYRHFPN